MSEVNAPGPAGETPSSVDPLPMLEPPDPQRPASAAPTQGQLASQALDYSNLGAAQPQLPESTTEAAHDPYAALRLPGYRLYALGYIASMLGQQIQSVAIGWQLFKAAGSISKGSLALGLVGGVQAIPVMLLAIPAGQLADQFDRRIISIVCQLGAAFCSIGLAVSSHHHASSGWMYLFLGLGASCQAMGWPARSALLPQVVPDAVFTNAATWNSTGFQLASVAGPALGGLVVAFTVTGAYLMDAGCSLAFCVFLFLLRPRKAVASREPATFRTLLAGVRFVWSTQIILATITLDLFAVLLGGAVYLMPIYASDILKVGPLGFGWLKAAPAIGALVMAMAMAHRPPMKRAGATMLWAVAGFGMATVVFGLSRSFPLSLLALAITGVCDNISVVIRHTLVQLLPPEEMRGRVSAVNNVFIGASNEIGGLESGLTAHFFSPFWSVVGGGIGTILVVLAVALAWPSVRRFGSLASLRPSNTVATAG